ncbi:MAG: hypothetical protein AAF401_03010 [Pseudomonadota bacterium]
MTFRAPKDGYKFPKAFMSPPVMAIGDSIYNGMRSATINAEMARKSVPASVSRVVDPNYRFRSPRYPEVLLIDVEQTLREIDLGDLVHRLKKRIEGVVANAQRWGSGQHVVQAEHAAWDNLSQAGAVVDDLITRDWGHWAGLVAHNLPKLNGVDSVDDLLGSGADILDLHMGLNAKFLINPNERDELKEMRPIDLVAARKPKRLLINIGANHGVIDITLRGVEAKDPKLPGEGLRGLADWAEQMKDMAGMLKALGPETETIYVNTVPLPSTVPNMMYPYNPREIHAHEIEKIDGYYPVYDNRLGGLNDYIQHTAAEMKELDREVAAINNKMIANMRAVGDDRLRFFRLDRALKKYDGKHESAKGISGDTPGARLEFPDRTYSNKAIDFDNFFIWDAFREGGVASLDNHHPSGVGYSVMARELVRVMKKDIPDLKLNRAMISEMGDKIFSDEPGEYASIIRVLYRLRRHATDYKWEPDLDEANGKDLPHTPVALKPDDADEAAKALGQLMGRVLRSPPER